VPRWKSQSKQTKRIRRPSVSVLDYSSLFKSLVNTSGRAQTVPHTPDTSHGASSLQDCGDGETHQDQRNQSSHHPIDHHRVRQFINDSLEEFIDLWAQHIPERYQHAVRSFGLFAPRALRQTSAAIFAILGQERRPRPKPRPWADSIKRDFGRDPLLDHGGKRMKRVRRLAPKTSH